MQCNDKVISWQHLRDVYASGIAKFQVCLWPPVPHFLLEDESGFSCTGNWTSWKVRTHNYNTHNNSQWICSQCTQVSAEMMSLRQSNLCQTLTNFLTCWMSQTLLYTGKHKRKDFQLPYYSFATDTMQTECKSRKPISCTMNLFSCLKNTFLKYLDEWECAVMKRPNFTDAEKFGIFLYHHLIALLLQLARSLILSNLCSKVYLTSNFFWAKRNFFGMQRQRGATNENLNAYQANKNTQALRVINTTWSM